jgi:hypothetical protein
VISAHAGNPLAKELDKKKARPLSLVFALSLPSNAHPVIGGMLLKPQQMG